MHPRTVAETTRLPRTAAPAVSGGARCSVDHASFVPLTESFLVTQFIGRCGLHLSLWSFQVEQSRIINPMDPTEASRYAEELWRRYAAILSPIVDAPLPPHLHARFKGFFDGLNLGELRTGVPDWVMSLYAMQDGLTAAYYRRRRVEEIEAAVIDICSKAVGSMATPLVPMNSSIRLSALSYEYQSYLFDFRRCFEYLASGLLGALNIEPPRNSTWRKTKEALENELTPSDPIVRQVDQISNKFSTVLGHTSPRNRLAHHGQVSAGAFIIYLEPGHEPRIALEGGGEELPTHQEGATTVVRLANVLQGQLELFEDAIFALLDLLRQRTEPRLHRLHRQ